jgi:two-component system, OmpR family, response regulator
LRILFVEDEPEFARAVASVLDAEGNAVDVVGNGTEALRWIATYTYDLLIVDVVLPGISGLAISRAVRERKLETPILMLTALDGIDDRVAGLDAGADDYLPKPFAMAELLARVRALRRRGAGQPEPILRIGKLELDAARQAVRVNNRPVRLTRKEYALLEVLARNAGAVMSQAQLIDAVWNADFAAESNVVEVHVSSLRRKLDIGLRASLIETVRGFGYRLGDGLPADDGAATRSSGAPTD